MQTSPAWVTNRVGSMPHRRDPAAGPAPLLLQRRSVIVACAVAVALTVMTFAGGASHQILVGLLSDGLLLLAWLAAAIGIGGTFFRLPRRLRPGERPLAVGSVAPPGAPHTGLPEFESLYTPSSTITFGPRPLPHRAVGPAPLSLVTAVAVGLGIIGLFALLLGVFGVVHMFTLYLMLVFGILLGVRKLRVSD